MTKKPDRDLGMLGVLIHVIGDAINNIGVMIAAVVIWKAEGHRRYYVDPAVSVFIGIMILVSALPLTKKSGAILLQVAPQGIGLDHVKEDMESVSESFFALLIEVLILLLSMETDSRYRLRT